VAAVGDIYQIVDAQRQNSQVCLNVFFYRRTAEVLVGNPAQQVADAFDTSVLPHIKAIQTNTVTHEEIRVTNLFDPSDTYTKLISEPGLSTEVESNPFDATGFRLVQSNGAVRNGAKRFAGAAEGDSTAGIITNTDFISLLILAGTAMVSGVDIGIVTNALIPVIVKRILAGGKYRLPANSGEAVFGDITDALYNVDVTSQVSRKYGRGE
jgi:hypothetical protein